jgi:hypothetical protein
LRGRPRENAKPSWSNVTSTPTARKAKLHERLEGDRGDHALVVLGGVEMARAEAMVTDQRHLARRLADRRCAGLRRMMISGY